MVIIKKDKGDERINIINTHWYKKLKSTITRGINLKIYRINYGYTQEKLGQFSDGIPRQHI